MAKKLFTLLKTSKLAGSTILLSLIVLLYLATRLSAIGRIPASVYWDEASIGYNAYSISTDLKDEWGELLPLHFRAFGEFKLPVYIYSTVPFVKILGLSAVSVRLPSLLYGLGTVIVVYFLIKNITKSSSAALLSAFYLTVSPWFFLFSVTGYEAVAGIFYLGLGLLFASWALENKMWFLASLPVFVAAVYSYNAMRIIVPIVLITMCIVLYKKVEKMILLAGIVLLAIAYIPIVRLVYYDQGAVRFTTVGVTSLMGVVANYFKHFSPEFLFSGDVNPRSSVPGWGIIWIIDLLALPLGVFYISKLKNKFGLIILLGFIISFLPAAITRESPHALRALSGVIFLSAIWGVGIFELASRIRKYQSLVYITVVVALLISFEGYFENFVKNYNRLTSEAWQYPYMKVYEKYNKDFSEFDKVIVSDNYAQPYIFFLFYGKTPPQEFRDSAVRSSPDKWGFSGVSSFGRFKFGVDNIDDYNFGNLVIAGPDDVLGPRYSETIDFADGTPALYVYDIR